MSLYSLPSGWRLFHVSVTSYYRYRLTDSHEAVARSSRRAPGSPSRKGRGTREGTLPKSCLLRSVFRLHTDPGTIERKHGTGTHRQVGLNDVCVRGRGARGCAGLQASRRGRHTKIDLIEPGEAWRCAREEGCHVRRWAAHQRWPSRFRRQCIWTIVEIDRERGQGCGGPRQCSGGTVLDGPGHCVSPVTAGKELAAQWLKTPSCANLFNTSGNGFNPQQVLMSLTTGGGSFTGPLGNQVRLFSFSYPVPSAVVGGFTSPNTTLNGLIGAGFFFNTNID